jgi:hypothetical protein
MEIITLSPISEEHAAGPHFPQARSADGKFYWHHGMPGYVSIDCGQTGLPDNTRARIGRFVVNLQHPPAEVTGDLLAEARAFSVAVDRLREERKHTGEHRPAEAVELTAEEARLLARYRTSEAAWDAEDEAAWAVLQRLGY